MTRHLPPQHPLHSAQSLRQQRAVRRPSRRGALLLEVLLAMALLAMGALIIGTQFSNSLTASRLAEARLRCVQLAELKIAELDAQMFTADAQAAGDFGPAFPQFTWAMYSQPSALLPELRASRQLYTVSMEVTYTDGSDQVSYTINTLRPGRIVFDVKTDLGLPDEAAEELTSQIPLTSLQQGELDIAELKAMDPLVLMEMLPQIMAALGSQAGSIPDASALQRAATDLVGEGADAEEIERQVTEQVSQDAEAERAREPTPRASGGMRPIRPSAGQPSGPQPPGPQRPQPQAEPDDGFGFDGGFDDDEE